MGSEANNGRLVEVLRDDADLCIEYLRQPQQAEVLVITFDPLLQLWPAPAFGHDFLQRCGVDVIAVRKKAEHFYQVLERSEFESLVAPICQRYARVLAYGSSLGAYAALYFGQAQTWKVLALSPRVSVHPVFGSPAWQDQQPFLHEALGCGAAPRCDATIFYDPSDDIDRSYLEGEVIPAFPGATYRRLRYAGHPVTQSLSEMGFLAPYLRALLQAQAEPVLDRTARRRSAAFLRGLADAALARRHLRWAQKLAEQASSLSPKYMLAHRSLGQVALVQQNWALACEALERALSLAPGDPWTAKLLQDAVQGANATRALLPAVAAANPAKRQLGRLRRLVQRLQHWVLGGA